jgi:hypothetical protein
VANSLDAAAVVEALLAKTPERISEARRVEVAGGLPSEPGFYAWWVEPGDLPAVPLTAHPSDSSIGLLYVGISPKRKGSSGVIRSRILGQHVGGNIASSTFKLDLAALLFVSRGWIPTRGAKKTLLTSADNRMLRTWQETHLRVSWCVRPRPWEIEHEVIGRIEPPLNVEANASHPFYSSIRAAREALRATAVNSSEPPEI